MGRWTGRCPGSASGSLIAKVGLFQPVFRFRLGPSMLAWADRVGLPSLPAGQPQRSGLRLHRLQPAESNREVRRCLPPAGGHCQRSHPGRHPGHGHPPLRPAALHADARATRRCCIPRPDSASCRDSAIVAGFIFIHNAARLLGESFHVASEGHADAWQPIISSGGRARGRA